MSATNGEALVSAINRLLVRLDVRGVSANEIIACIKQLIADSEARAVAQWSGGLDQSLPDLYEAAKAECDRLRAEVARLSEWQAGVIKNARAHHAQLKEANARAERAEASLHALRLVCGTTDADKFSTWVDRANARAERAEAELREMGADKLRWAMLATDRGDQVQRAEAERIALVKANAELDHAYRTLHGRLVTAQAELAAEKARLDWLESDAGMDFQWSTVRVITRAAIDSAMKEGK